MGLGGGKRPPEPFESDINLRMKLLCEIEPKLTNYKNEILANLEKFKRKREERIRNYEKSQKYLDSIPDLEL